MWCNKGISDNMNNYIKIKDNAHLIGKRAKFKDNLEGYCSWLWNQTGVIVQIDGVEHVGLSLKLDNTNLPLDTCYIEKDSYELEEVD